MKKNIRIVTLVSLISLFTGNTQATNELVLQLTRPFLPLSEAGKKLPDALEIFKQHSIENVKLPMSDEDAQIFLNGTPAEQNAGLCRLLNQAGMSNCGYKLSGPVSARHNSILAECHKEKPIFEFSGKRDIKDRPYMTLLNDPNQNTHIFHNTQYHQSRLERLPYPLDSLPHGRYTFQGLLAALGPESTEDLYYSSGVTIFEDVWSKRHGIYLRTSKEPKEYKCPDLKFLCTLQNK